MALTIGTPARNAACNAIVDLLDAGSANAAGACVLRDGAIELVTIPFNNPAFGNAATGVATMDNTPEPQANAIADGDADVAEFIDRDETVVMSGTAGTSGAEVNLDNVSIANGQLVKLTTGTCTVPAS